MWRLKRNKWSSRFGPEDWRLWHEEWEDQCQDGDDGSHCGDLPPPELETQADDEDTASTPEVKTDSQITQYLALSYQSSRPEDALQHAEGPPQLRTADLHGEDAGADDAITHSNKYPGEVKILNYKLALGCLLVTREATELLYNLCCSQVLSSSCCLEC